MSTDPSDLALQERLQELDELHEDGLIDDEEYQNAKLKIVANFSNPVQLTWDEFLQKTVVGLNFVVFIISRNTTETDFDSIFQQPKREVHKTVIIVDTPSKTQWHLFQGKKSPIVVIHTQTDDQISQIVSTIMTLDKQFVNLYCKTIFCDFTNTISYDSIPKMFPELKLLKPTLWIADSLEKGIDNIFSILESFNYSRNKWYDFITAICHKRWDSLIVVMCQHIATNFDTSEFDKVVASGGTHKVLTMTEHPTLQWNLYSWLACNQSWAIIVIHGTSLSDMIKVSNQWPTRELTLFYNFSEKWKQKELHIPQSIHTWKCSEKLLNYIQHQVNNPDLSEWLSILSASGHYKVTIDNQIFTLDTLKSLMDQERESLMTFHQTVVSMNAHINAVVCANNLTDGLGFLFAMLYKFPTTPIVKPVQVTIRYKDPITETLRNSLDKLNLNNIHQENQFVMKCETTFSIFLNLFIIHQKAKQENTYLNLFDFAVDDIIHEFTPSTEVQPAYQETNQSQPQSKDPVPSAQKKALCVDDLTRNEVEELSKFLTARTWGGTTVCVELARRFAMSNAAINQLQQDNNQTVTLIQYLRALALAHERSLDYLIRMLMLSPPFYPPAEYLASIQARQKSWLVNNLTPQQVIELSRYLNTSTLELARRYGISNDDIIKLGNFPIQTEALINYISLHRPAHERTVDYMIEKLKMNPPFNLPAKYLEEITPY